MDGIFVAHHNTREIFGFQYLPVEEMDVAMNDSPELADMAFKLCLGTLEQILRYVLAENAEGMVSRMSLARYITLLMQYLPTGQDLHHFRTQSQSASRLRRRNS